MIYEVKERQNIFDVCIQELSSIELLFDLLSANNLDINSDLYSGQAISIPNLEIENSKSIQQYYKNKGIEVVSELQQVKPKADFKKTDFNNDFNI